MNRRARCVMVLLAGVVAGCSPETATAPPQPTVRAKPGGPPGGDIAVTTIVADNDTSVAPAFQVLSDGLGAYHNANNLTSKIQGAGAWVLDSYNPRNGTRRLTLDFSQPIAGSAPGGSNPVALPTGAYLIHAISKCNIYGSAMQNLAPGTSMPCPLHIAFDYAGTKYALQMNPVNGTQGVYPETNYAIITCTLPASGTGPCTRWRITPSGTFVDGGGVTRYRNVAKLLNYVPSGKNNTVTVDRGDFYVSFAIGVNNP